MSAPTSYRGSRSAAAVAAVALFAWGCTPPADTGNEATLRAAEPSAAAGVSLVELPPPATAWIIFGADTVVAEVAQTEDDRARGLMYREELGAEAGMLFVFPESAVRSFWMENTYIPLDIAFMDASFRIVDIQQMEPMTTNPHMSRGPAMYALEVNQGWFEAHGVRPGDTPKVVFGG